MYFLSCFTHYTYFIHIHYSKGVNSKMTVNAFLFQIKCSKCFFNFPLITVAMQLPQKYQRSPTLIIINVTEHQISILERLVKIQLCHHRNKAHYKIFKNRKLLLNHYHNSYVSIMFFVQCICISRGTQNVLCTLHNINYINYRIGECLCSIQSIIIFPASLPIFPYFQRFSTRNLVFLTQKRVNISFGVVEESCRTTDQVEGIDQMRSTQVLRGS